MKELANHKQRRLPYKAMCLEAQNRDDWWNIVCNP